MRSVFQELANQIETLMIRYMCGRLLVERLPIQVLFVVRLEVRIVRDLPT